MYKLFLLLRTRNFSLIMTLVVIVKEINNIFTLSTLSSSKGGGIKTESPGNAPLAKAMALSAVLFL